MEREDSWPDLRLVANVHRRVENQLASTVVGSSCTPIQQTERSTAAAIGQLLDEVAAESLRQRPSGTSGLSCDVPEEVNTELWLGTTLMRVAASYMRQLQVDTRQRLECTIDPEKWALAFLGRSSENLYALTLMLEHPSRLTPLLCTAVCRTALAVFRVLGNLGDGIFCCEREGRLTRAEESRSLDSDVSQWRATSGVGQLAWAMGFEGASSASLRRRLVEVMLDDGTACLYALCESVAQHAASQEMDTWRGTLSMSAIFMLRRLRSIQRWFSATKTEREEPGWGGPPASLRCRRNPRSGCFRLRSLAWRALHAIISQPTSTEDVGADMTMSREEAKLGPAQQTDLQLWWLLLDFRSEEDESSTQSSALPAVEERTALRHAIKCMCDDASSLFPEDAAIATSISRSLSTESSL